MKEIDWERRALPEPEAPRRPLAIESGLVDQRQHHGIERKSAGSKENGTVRVQRHTDVDPPAFEIYLR